MGFMFLQQKNNIMCEKKSHINDNILFNNSSSQGVCIFSCKYTKRSIHNLKHLTILKCFFFKNEHPEWVSDADFACKIMFYKIVISHKKIFILFSKIFV